MIETFFKTEVPKAEREQHEYHTLLLIALPTSAFFHVSQHHGWWDAEQKKSKLTQILLHTTDDPVNETEAFALYDQQREYLLRNGFNHVYHLDPNTGDEVHTRVEPKG